MVTTAAADERAGRRSPNGDCRLLKGIAQGDYAEVFRAGHRDRPGQLVAFKWPLAAPFARERMIREIEWTLSDSLGAAWLAVSAAAPAHLTW